MSTDPISLVSLGVAVLSFIVTVALTIGVWRSGSRAQQQTQEILGVLQGLVTANRLDELALQARDLRAHEHLKSVLGETCEILKSADQKVAGSAVRVFQAYWANPVVPITEASADLPDEVRVFQDNFGPKLDLSGRPIDDLITFMGNCSQAETFQAHYISDWILEQYRLGLSISDSEIRRLLQGAPRDLYGALLHGLDSIREPLPVPMRVNVLAGVANAYLDRIGFYPIASWPTEKQGATHETDFGDLSLTVLSGLAHLLHRANLRSLAQWDSEECSISASCSAALVIACAGAASFCDGHLAMRCLQNLEQLKVLPAEIGVFERQYRFGIAKFVEHQPELLTGFWPEGADYVQRAAS